MRAEKLREALAESYMNILQEDCKHAPRLEVPARERALYIAKFCLVGVDFLQSLWVDALLHRESNEFFET